MKKYIILVMSLFLIFMFPMSVFADDISVNESKNIDEERVVKISENFIEDIIANDESTTWTNDTIIDNIVETYDVDGNINAYILNLKTKGNPTGYILIEVFDTENPIIAEFGYDGVYYITNKDINKNISEDMIYIGNREFVVEDNGSYIDAASSEKTDISEEELRENYQSQININNLEVVQKKLEKSMTSRNISAKQVVYSSVSLPNLWAGGSYSKDFLPMKTSDFSGYSKHCVPTCGINMLKYWSERRGKTNLIYTSNYNNAFAHLRVEMKHSNSSGTSDSDGYNGMKSYISKYKLRSQLGSNYATPKNFDWKWITSQINNGNALYIGKTLQDYDGRNSGHAFLGVGYQNTSDGEYIRVCDNWDTSLSHFVKYKWSNIDAIWYLRW
ncbi:C39 family peptidase [Clostridium sp. UBA7339]|uniref:C39 family peptidase n=1 Tax=Clostridium sp. UBA7339 TaxID=1946376 RepID=UPI003216E84F